MSFLLAFLAFVILIVLHELGHFVAAKATGMRVERFFLFFPPKLFSVGGFVKITGMNPDEELPPEVADRGYYHQPVWKRIVVIGAGPAVNIAIAFIILFFLAFGIQETSERVDEVATGSPAESRLVAGDRIISVDGVRGDQVAIADQIDSHGCAGEPVDGCAAETPATVVIERDGSRQTIEVRPEYDAENDRNRNRGGLHVARNLAHRLDPFPDLPVRAPGGALGSGRQL